MIVIKMEWIRFLWSNLTETQALKETSGKHELAFFESVYRVVYLVGFSRHDRGTLYLLYSSTVKLLIVLFVVAELWYLFTMSSSLDMAIANMSVTFIHLIAMYRYQDMIKHKDIYKNLASSMESQFFDVSTQKRKIIVKFWLMNNERFLKLLLALGSCTLAAWFVYPLVDDLEYNLVVAIRLPFDYNTTVSYLFTYTIVVIAFDYTSYFVMVNDLMMQTYLLHLLCQFQILGDCFESIVTDCSVGFVGHDPSSLFANERFQRKYIHRLRNLVQQHQFILQQTQQLKKILSTPMLCQLGASSMLICFAGYQVTATVREGVAKFLMSLLYLAYNMFELFIFCRWCEEIKIQSEQIRESVYMSGWERGLVTIPGVRRRLALVAARAARPLVLTAGGLCDLSLSSYGTIVKTSYSALTMLLRVRRE